MGMLTRNISLLSFQTYGQTDIYSYRAGLAILLINYTKKSRNVLKYVEVYFVFYVTEEGWERIEGKGEGGCEEIFL